MVTWVKVRLAGLNVYSGYWLAVDAPTNGIEDPLQEEGIDTLRRVMEAAGIKFTGVLSARTPRSALCWKRAAPVLMRSIKY